MKHANTTLSCLVVMIGGTVLALSNIAEAKGYSPAMEVSATERQDIERRLTQVEERQQQVAVLQSRSVQFAALRFCKQTAERG
jgi:hypothetical protein